MPQILPASLGPRSLDLTRMVQARCRTYADGEEIFLHAVGPGIWSQRCTPRVQRQPRLSTALKPPDLAEHGGTNAIRCRVVVGGQPSGNGGEDLRRLGAVVLRACGLREAAHIGLGDVVHPPCRSRTGALSSRR